MDDERRHRPVLPTTLWVKGSDTLDLIIPEGNAIRHTIEAFDSREDVYRIPLDTEVARLERDAVIDIVVEYEVTLELVLAIALPILEADNLLLEGLRVCHTIETGYRRDHDHILSPREQRGCRPESKLLDLGIDRHILLYVGIGGSDIGLGLVVVVVGDEVLHSVIGEEGLELGVELRCQGLVVAQYERGLFDLSDDVGCRKGLPRPCHPE